jgi:hypothetical protein
MNPNAKEFVPNSKTFNPNAKEFVPNSKTLHMNELDPVYHELFAEHTMEAQIKKIPKITNYLNLEQVVQISYYDREGANNYELFSLYWDGQNAILDSYNDSWQFPDMTLRAIIHYHFDNDTSVKISDESHALDEPASYAPCIQVDVTQIFDELDWKI